MNNSELKRILESARLIENVGFEYASDRKVVRFSGLNSFRKSLDYLYSVRNVLPKIKEIEEDKLFQDIIQKNVDSIEVGEKPGSVDSIRIDYYIAISLRSKIDSLLDHYATVNRVLNFLSAPEIGENSISIKMSKVRDLDDLYKTAQDFNIIFSQLILNEKIGGFLEIKNVENGSVWLDVFVGTPLAVSVIGSLTWAAAVVYKKVQEGRVFAEYVKSLKIKNDSLSDMRSAQDALLKSMIEIEARNIETQYFGDGNNEQLERIKKSISLLANQIEKGSEVHPYLNAPEDVKNLFPDMKKL